MKFTEHKGRTKIAHLAIRNASMIVWPSKFHELTIEKGDTVRKVVDVICTLDVYKKMSRNLLTRLVNYWFDIGESRARYTVKRRYDIRRFNPR